MIMMHRWRTNLLVLILAIAAFACLLYFRYNGLTVMQVSRSKKTVADRLDNLILCIPYDNTDFRDSSPDNRLDPIKENGFVGNRH